MLPRVELDVLSTNPKFEVLYHDLCTKKLNEDGTTRLDARALKERDLFEQELRQSRIEATKKGLVRSVLQDLAYRGDELPEELQELVAVIAASLGGEIAAEDRDVIEDTIAQFQENVVPIAAGLSKKLRDDATILARILAPEVSPSVQMLPKHIKAIQADIDNSRSRLAHSRLALATSISALHSLYRQVVQTSIRILEQTIHGSMARETKAKAEYLAIVAEGMSRKLSLQRSQLLQQMYTTNIQDILKQRFESMDEECRLLRRRLTEAEKKLEQYGKDGGMELIAREYAELVSEREKVRGDVEKLLEGEEGGQ